MVRKNLPVFTNFNKIFGAYICASKLWLGEVIFQEGNLIDLNINPRQGIQ